MPYLIQADLTDKLLNELLNDDGGDNSDYLNRADRKVESLAENFGIRDVTRIGWDVGDADGVILVNGGGQTGKTLAVDGFTESGGTVKQGTKVRIVGLKKTSELIADAGVSGNAATFSLLNELEIPPADDAIVDIQRLHPEVREWLVSWVHMTVAMEFAHLDDGQNVGDVDIEKYVSKWRMYQPLEKTLRLAITREMLTNEVDEILDKKGGSTQWIRG